MTTRANRGSTTAAVESAARPPATAPSEIVQVRGARENNLKNIDVSLPRNSLVAFTGISGSGKSSLAFGTLYAEAQRRYLESVSPYARRLFHQLEVPDVDAIEGLPPAVALQQQRGAPTTRSSVGSVTTMSNLLRMLYSRAGSYPKRQPLLPAEAFSANTPAGACPECHGLGRLYTVTERSMVPDDTKTIRERAVQAWPPAWHGTNLRDMLITLGYDVDKPWRELPKKERDWILFTDEQPVVPVYIGWNAAEIKRALRKNVEPSYHGNFTSVKKYVLTTFATATSDRIKKRVAKYLVNAECPLCRGNRLRKEALSVTFAGLDIAEISRLSLSKLYGLIEPFRNPRRTRTDGAGNELTAEKLLVIERITDDLLSRLSVLIDLGLGYLSLDRTTPTLSPGELQRLRLATQVRSNLFGVAYVLDEPSAGLHLADTEALLRALDQLKGGGNSLFVVEHELDVVRRADWIVDVGPDAGQRGGRILYSGPLEGLRSVDESHTRRYLFEHRSVLPRAPRHPRDWVRLEQITRNNVRGLSVEIPIGTLTTVTGVSGSGKSTVVSQVLVELVAKSLGAPLPADPDESDELERSMVRTEDGVIVGGLKGVTRLVRVDQKPIGRTPRSNLATYTGLFDHVRRLFASTKGAKQRRFDAGRFSFNLAKGRCATCEGEGFVMVELLFLPSVYAPCGSCRGSRYNSGTLEVHYHGKNIADVLALTVDEAADFFRGEHSVTSALTVLQDVGLGYLRLGQSATELSGGEAQRIKLATELQRGGRGGTLYVLDEPTTGLHPFDVERLLLHLNRLVEGGNTVVTVEHDMQVIAASDWVIDMGPGAGDEGGMIVFAGSPEQLRKANVGETSKYLRRHLENN